MKKTILSGKRSKRSHLTRRLAAYSATAGAALVISSPANAAINLISDPHVSFNFLDSGLIGFRFQAGPFTGAIKAGNMAGVSGIASLAKSFAGSIRQYTGSGSPFSSVFTILGNANFAGAGGNIFNLPGNALIKGLNFNASGLVASHSDSSNSRGSFVNSAPNGARTGYIALKAGAGATLKYGWMRARVQNSASGNPAKFSFVAKEGAPTVFGAWVLNSDPLAAIFVTGDTIPEPSTMALGGLGLLALGAAGVREMRQRRKAHASVE